MTANITRFIAAGFKQMQYSLQNTAGVPTGTTTTSLPANGADIGIGRVYAVQTADLSVAEPDFVNIPGDDDVQGQFIFSPGTVPNFTVTSGEMDLTFSALTETTSTRAAGDFTFRAVQPSAAVYRDVILLLTSDAKSQASGSTGAAGYHHVLIPKCNIVPLGRNQFAGREGANFRYRVAPTRVNTMPWGDAVDDTDWGTTGLMAIEFYSDYLVSLHTFIGDNSAASFTVDNTPVNDTDVCIAWRVDTGATLTVSTITAATKTITLSAAPASGLGVVLMYAYTA